MELLVLCLNSLIVRATEIYNTCNTFSFLSEYRKGVPVGDWRPHQRFVVTDSLNTGPMLGADFLSNNKMVVDFREQQLQWQGGAAR